MIYLHQNALGYSLTRIDGADTLEFHNEEREQASLEHQRTTQRQIGIGAQILLDLNIRHIRLMTNHPRRVAALEGYGIEIVEHIPIPASLTRKCDTSEEEIAVVEKLVAPYAQVIQPVACGPHSESQCVR